MRLPLTAVQAEYRGQAPASTFEARDTGEVVELAPNLRFEIELPDGDVETVSFRQNQLDKAADFDPATLRKGETVVFDGIATVGMKRGEDSYVRLVSMRREQAPRPAKVAS